MKHSKNRQGKRFRIDFDLLPGDEPGMVYMVLDSRKYDPITEDGKIVAYANKKTGAIITIEDLDALTNQPLLGGYFIRSFDSLKQEVCSFLREFKSELLKHWNEPYELEVIGLPLAQILPKLRGKEIEIVVVYVDMEGSTTISASVDMWTNVKINKIFQMLMSQIIANFGGFVYKPVGDEVIGVFPAGRFVPASDNAVYAAMTMHAGVADVLNPLFEVKNCLKLGFILE